MSVGFPVPMQYHIMPMSSVAQGGTVQSFLGYVECALTGAGPVYLPHLSSPHLLTGTSLYLRNVSGYTATVTASTTSVADTIDGVPTFSLSSGNSLHLLSHPVDHTWKVVCECEVPNNNN